MTGQEFLGNNEHVYRRAKWLAQRFSVPTQDEVRKHWQQLSLGPKPIVTPEEAERNIELYGQRALFRYVAKRAAGLDNDQWSMFPGLKTLITANCIERFAALAHDPQAPSVPMTITELEDGLYGVDLPSGRFHDSGKISGLYIFPDDSVKPAAAMAKDIEGEPLVPNGAIALNREDHVIRIEGKMGELWQNPHMAVDGRPR